MADSLQAHGLQHIRLPCPSPTPRGLLKLMSIESLDVTSHLPMLRVREASLLDRFFFFLDQLLKGSRSVES